MRFDINYLTLKSRHHRRGVAALEFLFAAPAFFVLVFFVVEIALVWNDRHMMRLAAYRAARTVVKMRAEAPTITNLCWGPLVGTEALPANPVDVAIAKAARRSAAKVMSTVTPTTTQMLGSLGSSSAAIAGQSQEAVAQEVLDGFGQGVASAGTAIDAAATNPYVHAIYRMMNGLPAALMFTELECRNVTYPAGSQTNNGVEIQLTYRRSAKMPYIGNIMWMVLQIGEYFKAHGLGDYDGNAGMVKVNPLNYGLDLAFSTSDPLYQNAVDNFTTTIQNTLRTKAVDIATSAGNKIRENLGAPSGRAASNGMDKIFQVVTPMVTNKLDEFSTANTSVVNSIGEAGLNLFLQFPDFFKTIPIRVSVRIPNYSQAYVNAGNNWDGKAVMLGRFTNRSNMGLLAQALGDVLDAKGTTDSPNRPGETLPYVANP